MRAGECCGLILFCIQIMTNCIQALKYCSGEVCIPSNYNRLQMPLTNDTNNVTVAFNGLQILKVDDYDCQIHLTFELALKWMEPRIIGPFRVPNHILLDESYLKQLWLPDLYIHNVKNIKKHSLLSDFENLSYIGNNTLLYFVQLEVSIFCPMTFEAYPLDDHVCHLILGSFKYDASVINFVFEHLDFEDVFAKVSNLDYETTITPITRHQHNRFYSKRLFLSRAGFNIRLERNVRKYMLNYYLPSGILVTISWVSIVKLIWNWK